MLYGHDLHLERLQSMRLSDSEQSDGGRSSPPPFGPQKRQNSIETVMTDETQVTSDLPHSDRGFCSWLWALFRLSDHHLYRKCGQDAVQYANFQRTMIVYLSIICVLSVVVILPINFQGNQEPDKHKFGHTTISNLPTEYELLFLFALFFEYFMTNPFNSLAVNYCGYIAYSL